MKIKKTLNTILNDVETPQGRLFAFIIQGIIVLSLVTFSLGTLPNLSLQTNKLLSVIEVVTVIIFTVEYVLRIYVAERKTGFIFSFFGIIDLLAILPFYVSLGVDLRSVRVFRLLRLLRILKLMKYNAAIKRFHRALVISKEELILFGFVSVIMLYLSAVGIYYFEGPAQPDQFQSVFHCLWWAVTTLTTVGLEICSQ